MKTLKEELQEILDEKKLNDFNPYICNHLSGINGLKFQIYKEMAQNYTKEFFSGGYSWWRLPSDEYVLSEKYRFIKDLIAIL